MQDRAEIHETNPIYQPQDCCWTRRIPDEIVMQRGKARARVKKRSNFLTTRKIEEIDGRGRSIERVLDREGI